MTFNEYQKKAFSTAIYPSVGVNLLYPALGLAGEAGEVAGKIKKLWRDHNITNGRDISQKQSDSIRKEIGDVLWYCATLARELNVNLDDIASENLKKLEDRKNRAVLGGSGDNR